MHYDRIPADAAAITPSDSTLLQLAGLYVGGAGNVTVTTEKGTDVVFTAPPVGTTIWLRIQKVKVATTATNLVGLKLAG